LKALEPGFVRPRQARYQAALRPDLKYIMIIKYFPTEPSLRGPIDDLMIETSQLAQILRRPTPA
jgi:hypothetical protein